MTNMHDPRSPVTFDEVVSALKTEHQYQLRRWGYRQPDGSFLEADHCVTDWLVYMKHYLDKTFAEASEKSGNAAALEMLRKVVMMGVACFMQNGISARDLNTPVVNGRDGLPA